MSFLTRILVYGGHKTPSGHMRGPYGTSVLKHKKMFQKAFPRARLQVCEGSEFYHKMGSVSPQSTLIVIPAGESSELDSVFKHHEIERIKERVFHGMNITGTCGSAYWLSKQSIWNHEGLPHPEKKKSLIKERRCDLLPALAVGPLSPYPGQPFSEAFRHEPVHVRCQKREVCLLLSGGGTFFPMDDKVKTIACYAEKELARFQKDPTWMRAAVTCRYGDGRVILSMLHPGHSAEEIDVDTYQEAFPGRDDDWDLIKRSLSPENERMAFVQEMFELTFSI